MKIPLPDSSELWPEAPSLWVTHMDSGFFGVLVVLLLPGEGRCRAAGFVLAGRQGHAFSGSQWRSRNQEIDLRA